MTTASAVLELRKKLALKQEEFAKRLGATSVTVSRWEHSFQPSRKFLQKLAFLAKEAKAFHLEELFEATRRADIISGIERLPSSRSPRRITVVELKHWATLATALFDETNSEVAKTLTTEITLHINQPWLRPS